MPDEDFKAGQEKHATFIKVSRHLAELSGMTPGQVRAQLRGFNDKVEGRGTRAEVNQAVKMAPGGPNFYPKSQPTKFEPRPFGQATGDKNNAGQSQLPELIEDVIIVKNGVATYYDLYGIEKGPV